MRVACKNGCIGDLKDGCRRRIAGDVVQLELVDPRTDADDDEYDRRLFGLERRIQRCLFVVGSAIGEQYNDVRDIHSRTCSGCEHLSPEAQIDVRRR